MVHRISSGAKPGRALIGRPGEANVPVARGPGLGWVIIWAECPDEGLSISELVTLMMVALEWVVRCRWLPQLQVPSGQLAQQQGKAS
jgi:hypothetical protein